MEALGDESALVWTGPAIMLGTRCPHQGAQIKLGVVSDRAARRWCYRARILAMTTVPTFRLRRDTPIRE